MLHLISSYVAKLKQGTDAWNVQRTAKGHSFKLRINTNSLARPHTSHRVSTWKYTKQEEFGLSWRTSKNEGTFLRGQVLV